MGSKEKEMPQSNGCCCECNCRQKTWLEIVAERVSDPNERETIVQEFARQREEIDRLKQEKEDLFNCNQGLALEVGRLSMFVKNVECREADARHEVSMGWFKKYLLNEMKDIDNRINK